MAGLPPAWNDFDSSSIKKVISTMNPHDEIVRSHIWTIAKEPGSVVIKDGGKFSDYAVPMTISMSAMYAITKL